MTSPSAVTLAGMGRHRSERRALADRHGGAAAGWEGPSECGALASRRILIVCRPWH